MRRYGPKTANHPSIGQPCWSCDVPFEAGDFTALVVTAPANKEAREKARRGQSYNAEAREVHWTCASRLPPADVAQ